jgi:hypothetical protein
LQMPQSSAEPSMTLPGCPTARKACCFGKRAQPAGRSVVA